MCFLWKSISRIRWQRNDEKKEKKKKMKSITTQFSFSKVSCRRTCEINVIVLNEYCGNISCYNWVCQFLFDLWNLSLICGRIERSASSHTRTHTHTHTHTTLCLLAWPSVAVSAHTHWYRTPPLCTGRYNRHPWLYVLHRKMNTSLFSMDECELQRVFAYICEACVYNVLM